MSLAASPREDKSPKDSLEDKDELEEELVTLQYLRGKNFVGKNFRHLPKISSLFTDENFNLVFYMRTFL